jgi:integrase
LAEFELTAARDRFMSTKSEQDPLPLTWDAIAAVRSHRDRVQPYCELVFPGNDGEVLDGAVANDALQKIAKALDMGHVHNYMLRHTFASHAVMRGIPMRRSRSGSAMAASSSP